MILMVHIPSHIISPGYIRFYKDRSGFCKIFEQEFVVSIMIMTTPAIRRAVASDDSGDLESDGEPAPDIILAPGQSRTNVAGSDSLLLRSPVKEDGRFIHQLIRQCPPLDLNSIYTYLLLCEHFSQTCVVAEIDGRICGFVSAYRHPERTDVLFVWQ